MRHRSNICSFVCLSIRRFVTDCMAIVFVLHYDQPFKKLFYIIVVFFCLFTAQLLSSVWHYTAISVSWPIE